jgi:hypothetical protein
MLFFAHRRQWLGHFLESHVLGVVWDGERLVSLERVTIRGLLETVGGRALAGGNYSVPAPRRLTSSLPGKPNEYRTPVYFFGKKASKSDGVNNVLPVPT